MKLGCAIQKHAHMTVTRQLGQLGASVTNHVMGDDNSVSAALCKKIPQAAELAVLQTIPEDAICTIVRLIA
jgi:hypothetical protein